MSKPDPLLRNAELCERYARLCPLDHQRHEFEQMARDWRRMADEAARLRPQEKAAFA